MSRGLSRALWLAQRMTALLVIIAATRQLPGLLPVLLLILCFLAFRRAVIQEAAARVAESLSMGQRTIPSLSWKDLVVDGCSVFVLAFGAATFPKLWSLPPLAVGAFILSRNAPLRAASRLLDMIDRGGPPD